MVEHGLPERHGDEHWLLARLARTAPRCPADAGEWLHEELSSAAFLKWVVV